MRRSLMKALGIIALVVAAACAPQPTPPPVNLVATAAIETVLGLLTQTAAAIPPTLTLTVTPSPTETPVATPTSSEPPRRPMTVNFAGCWFGPGPTYTLESNIDKGKGVELLGTGSVPGWYIIRNPYFHRPCWIQATDLKIFEGTDLSKYPVMTPGEPLMGM